MKTDPQTGSLNYSVVVLLAVLQNACKRFLKRQFRAKAHHERLIKAKHKGSRKANRKKPT